MLGRHLKYSAGHWPAGVVTLDYQRTTEAWRANMDRRARAIEPLLADIYGDEATSWKVRWRVFFMACAELFGYRGGREWCASHYLFRK